jgi:C1A family cysteine protease
MNYLCQVSAMSGLLKCDQSNQPTVQNMMDFQEHISAHGLSFGTQAEYKYRLNLFAKADAEIKELNASEEFEVGHNEFSTMTEEEYNMMQGTFIDEDEAEYMDVADDLPTDDLAESVNWVEAGGVNPIQDQKTCGSCWAFGAIAQLEGTEFARTGNLYKLSEQQIVDCVGENGCKGGWYGKALRASSEQPVMLAKDYKY